MRDVEAARLRDLEMGGLVEWSAGERGRRARPESPRRPAPYMNVAAIHGRERLNPPPAGAGSAAA